MNPSAPQRPLPHRRARGGVVVLGGGFAGAQLARALGRRGATIVNPTNFMLYTPLLPEAAAGALEPRHVVVPLRAMCPHAELVLGTAVSIDAGRRTVTVVTGAGRVDLAYEQLVVALGAVTRNATVPGAAEHALGLKDIGDAIRLRNHVLRQIELADADPATADRRLTFVVAGGGCTGVEVVAELAELVTDALRRHPRLAGVRPRWVLVDGADRLLAQLPEPLSRAAARELRARGALVLTGTHIASVGPGGITLADGRRIATETVVWTAGVGPNPAVARLALPCDARGRVRVDSLLRVAGRDRIWALGDCAAVPNPASPGGFDPPTCQHALRQARRLARNLSGRPRPYRYRSRGQMASLGRRRGVALVGGLQLRGAAGWLVARGFHVLALPFVSRRARVLADLAAGACFRRDVAELSLATGGAR